MYHAQLRIVREATVECLLSPMGRGWVRGEIKLTVISRTILMGVMAIALVGGQAADGQLRIRHGAPVSVEVKSLYEAGLKYLVEQQSDDGTWKNTQYGAGPGTDGLCLLAILSSGEDPNYGRFAENIRKTVRSIIRRQNEKTGLLTQRSDHGSMYHHGFGTLALAEAYGAVNEELLWKDDKQGSNRRSIGKALELAVGCILTSQNQNPHGGWRYTPTTKSADTSVSGANIVALLAARNAGIEVPDENIDKAVKLFENCTGPSGAVAYSVGSVGSAFGDSLARSSIACLTFAIAKRKDLDAYQRTLQHLTERIDQPPTSWKYYTRYYMAQALFQGDFETWKKWDQINTEMLQEELNDNGSIGSDPYSTSMSLLSMALNFRFLPIYER